MTASAEPSQRSFDLSMYAIEASRQDRVYRRLSLLAIGAMLFDILVFLPETLIRAFHGQVSSLELTVTVFALLFGGVVIRSAVITYRRHGSSATAISVDRSGFELTYPAGSQSRVDWDDPTLRFDLSDYSSCPPGGSVSTRFGISIKGLESPLPEEAYRVLLREVGLRGLLVTTEKRGNMFYAKGWVPTIHHVRALPPTFS